MSRACVSVSASRLFSRRQPVQVSGSYVGTQGGCYFHGRFDLTSKRSPFRSSRVRISPGYSYANSTGQGQTGRRVVGQLPPARAGGGTAPGPGPVHESGPCGWYTNKLSDLYYQVCMQCTTCGDKAYRVPQSDGKFHALTRMRMRDTDTCCRDDLVPS